MKRVAKPSINKVIKTLIKADVLVLSAFGFITPIFAIFITQQIRGGDVKVAGFAAAIYWILKSLFQIPISKFLDKTKGEKDDLYFLVIGFVISALVPFGYIFSSIPWHIYLLQVIYAIGLAMVLPSWCAIFTRHIDKGKEAFEWALDSTAIGLGVGVTGALGGILVSLSGFNVVFIIVGILSLIGALLPLLIYKDIVPKKVAPISFPEAKKPPL
jgi:predicted MFS family arabinose efflux permease